MTPRRGCALSLFLALAGAALLLFIFVLVLQGEVRIGNSESNNFRIWLVRDSSNQGIGASTTQMASVTPTDATGYCQETAVQFFLWRTAGDIQNTTYCECYTAQGAFLGACPPSND